MNTHERAALIDRLHEHIMLGRGSAWRWAKLLDMPLVDLCERIGVPYHRAYRQTLTNDDIGRLAAVLKVIIADRYGYELEEYMAGVRDAGRAALAFEAIGQPIAVDRSQAFAEQEHMLKARDLLDGPEMLSALATEAETLRAAAPPIRPLKRCPACAYEWPARVERPRKCPRCQRQFVYGDERPLRPETVSYGAGDAAAS